MRVLLVAPLFPPEIGGPATYSFEVKEKLGSLGHQVSVITAAPAAGSAQDVYVVPKPKLGINYLTFFWHHLLMICHIFKAAKDYDLIYTQGTVHYAFDSLVAARLCRKPIALRFVGDASWEAASNRRLTNKYLEDFLKSPEGGIRIKYLISLQRFVFNSVDKIIVPSEFLRDIIINYYHVQPEKVKVVYNSINLDDYSDLPKEVSAGQDNPVIITVSRLARLKAVDGIITAVKELTKEYPNIKLWVVGEGPEKGNLEALATELNIRDRVDFLGQRAHSEVLSLLKQSDIFVLNSVHEGLPHVVIEAMACRVPVIATNIKGTGEVVTDGKTGLLVTPGDIGELKDKLAQLIQSDDLRNRLVADALALVKQKFTWEKNLPLLERELESVV